MKSIKTGRFLRLQSGLILLGGKLENAEKRKKKEKFIFDSLIHIFGPTYYLVYTTSSFFLL